jgi:hypothetical protein
MQDHFEAGQGSGVDECGALGVVRPQNGYQIPSALQQSQTLSLGAAEFKVGARIVLRCIDNMPRGAGRMLLPTGVVSDISPLPPRPVKMALVVGALAFEHPGDRPSDRLPIRSFPSFTERRCVF